MRWKDRISFALAERLQIKRDAFLSIIAAAAERRAGHQVAPLNLEKAISRRFWVECEFALMTGEVALPVADLVTRLGGEKPPLA